MYFRQIIGKYGEDLACNYLKDNNYIIIDRNFIAVKVKSILLQRI